MVWHGGAEEVEEGGNGKADLTELAMTSKQVSRYVLAIASFLNFLSSSMTPPYLKEM